MIFQLNGLVVTVRKPEIDDLATLAGWLASDDWVEHLGGSGAMAPAWYRQRAEAMLQDNANDASPNKYFLVADRFSGAAVGLAMLCKIDWKNRHAEYAFIIGAPAYRNGLAAGDMNMVMYNYFFNELNLNKVYGYIFDSNAVSLRMNGFGGSRDGTLRRHRRHRGAAVDVHVFCLSRRDFAQFVERHAATLLRKHLARGLVRAPCLAC
jgi:RimJ/RimL family protein N-acetyltransferase